MKQKKSIRFLSDQKSEGFLTCPVCEKGTVKNHPSYVGKCFAFPITLENQRFSMDGWHAANANVIQWFLSSDMSINRFAIFDHARKLPRLCLGQPENQRFSTSLISDMREFALAHSCRRNSTIRFVVEFTKPPLLEN